MEPIDLEPKIAGAIQCVDVSVSTCQAFIQAAQEERGSIELDLPSVDTPETPTPDTQPSDDQTEPADGELTPNSGGSPTSGEALQAKQLKPSYDQAMSESDQQTEDRVSQLGKWLSLGGSIIAPATLITTLLFYFGYVSSRAQYDYFGVDVDTIGLTTQDYVMRSPQPLLVPLLVLRLLGGGFLGAHVAARRHAAADPSFRAVAKRMVVGGLILLGVGVALLFSYAAIGDWGYYPLVTPLILAVGAASTAYGLSTIRWMDRRSRHDPRDSGFAGLAVVVSLWVAVAASLFWATATVAQWSGRGLAKGTKPQRTPERHSR